MMIIHLQDIIPSTIPQYDGILDTYRNISRVDREQTDTAVSSQGAGTRREDRPAGSEPHRPGRPDRITRFDQASII